MFEKPICNDSSFVTLSYWKQPSKDGFMVGIKAWTWSETMLR